MTTKPKIVKVLTPEELKASFAEERLKIDEIVVSGRLDEITGTTNEEAGPPAEAHDDGSLAFPEECMYGRMGEWARSLGTPLGHAYPAMLGAYSFVPDLDVMCGCRLGLYVCIVAPVGGGKNTSLVRAIQVLGLRKGLDWKVTTASSDRGLMDAIGSKTEGRGKDKKTVPGPRKLLLRTNEMGATLKKAAIDGSVLSDMLCEVWDTGEWECRDKGGSSECDCRMSWVGGVPVDADKPEQFAEAFGKFASRGLMSRMILGYHAGERFRHDGKEWTPTPGASETVLTGDDLYASLDKYLMSTPVRTVDPEAQRVYDAWSCPQDVDGRLKYNLMKVALLTASANHEGTVSPDCMAKAILFMDWQARLREVFKPSDAIGTPEAVLGEIIMRKFRSMPKSDQRGSLRSANGEIKWRRVAHDMKWAGYGAGVLDRAIKSLVAIGELEWGKTEKEDGSLKDNNKIVIVRWEGKK
ncbi:MAG: hypothetical protein ABSE40_19350 [Candidatus Sulfotelmatobacter sp.]|jgi:hypothetical protein